jgi:hypothetical protein
VAATLPLAVRRRFPLAVLVAVASALALQQVLTTPTQGLALLRGGMLAAYSSSAYSSVVRAAVAGVAIVGGAAFMGRMRAIGRSSSSCSAVPGWSGSW